MRTVAVAFFVLASCSVALSQDAPTPIPYGGAPPYAAGAGFGAPPVPRPLPAIPTPVAPQPAARAVCPKPVPMASGGVTARLEHLLEAAVHLEAAGETQQAQQVRGLVAQERRALLGQLDNEKCEVQTQQVLCHLRVVELSRSRLKKLGLDGTASEGDKAVSLSGEHLSAARLNVLDDSSALPAMLETLRKDKLARILAEPSLVGMSGQPVGFHTGSEFPVTTGGGLGHPERSFFVGTRVALVPWVIAPDRIRLEMKVTVTEPVEADHAASGQIPLFKGSTLHADTGVEMKSGQTLVLSGWTGQTSKPENEAIEALILITPEIADAPLAAQANLPVNSQR